MVLVASQGVMSQQCEAFKGVYLRCVSVCGLSAFSFWIIPTLGRVALVSLPCGNVAGRAQGGFWMTSVHHRLDPGVLWWLC